MKSRLRPSLEIGSGLPRLKEAASEFTSGQVSDSQESLSRQKRDAVWES
jgi:hypothetical protein